VLEAAFFVFRDRQAAIAAFSSGGTVLAGMFAALAAAAAWRSASESSATADRAREALARLNKPTMFATISIDSADPSVAVGSYGPDQYRGALDVRITWHLRGGRKVTKNAGVMIPDPTGRNEHLPSRCHSGHGEGRRPRPQRKR
jgi:hypothetical protein